MMMISTTNLEEEKEVQVKEEEKYHRLVLKENPSIRNPSFRYYSVKAGAVPFLWEIEPGTPKHPNSGSISSLIPPLTPPPSYLHCSNNKKNKNSPPTRAGLLAGILPRLKLKRKIKSTPSTLTSSSSVSSSSSSTLSSMTSTCRRRRRRRRRGRSRLSWGSSASTLSSGGGDDQEDSDGVDDHDSPKSVLCFGMKNINMEFLKKCVVSKALGVHGSTV